MKTVVEFVIDCFQRLCVLPRSARVSDEFIFGIWGNTYWSVLDSLTDFHLVLEFEDAEGNMKYGLHDVVLEYCEQASRFGHNSKYELYHREFLKCAWEKVNVTESHRVGLMLALQKRERTVIELYPNFGSPEHGRRVVRGGGYLYRLRSCLSWTAIFFKIYFGI